MSEWVTASGKRLTDEDMEALADQAEAGYDVSKINERYVLIRAADFRRMIAPRAMNYATAEAHRDEWVQLIVSDITRVRENLILENAVDQMYCWTDRDNIRMDCPDLNCTESIHLGRTPSLAQIKEAAREHVREAHGGGPIILQIEGPVHDPERGGPLVDDPAT